MQKNDVGVCCGGFIVRVAVRVELWWSEKIVFRRVTRRNLGEFGGLRCREFPKEMKLGFVRTFGCF